MMKKYAKRTKRKRDKTKVDVKTEKAFPIGCNFLLRKCVSIVITANALVCTRNVGPSIEFSEWFCLRNKCFPSSLWSRKWKRKNSAQEQLQYQQDVNIARHDAMMIEMCAKSLHILTACNDKFCMDSFYNSRLHSHSSTIPRFLRIELTVLWPFVHFHFHRKPTNNYFSRCILPTNMYTYIIPFYILAALLFIYCVRKSLHTMFKRLCIIVVVVIYAVNL